jgi:hypothetical protein
MITDLHENKANEMRLMRVMTLMASLISGMMKRIERMKGMNMRKGCQGKGDRGEKERDGGERIIKHHGGVAERSGWEKRERGRGGGGEEGDVLKRKDEIQVSVGYCHSTFSNQHHLRYNLK